jgi:hypothetical protein
MARRIRLATRLAPALAAAALVACGDSTTAPTIGEPTDPSLIGTWKGGIMRSIDDTPSSLTMILKVDSTASVLLPNFDPACSVAGPWTVSNGRLTVTMQTCTAVPITFTAPVATGRLSGTWSAGTTAGTFQVTKQ